MDDAHNGEHGSPGLLTDEGRILTFLQARSKPFTTSTETFTSVPCIRSVKQYTQVGKLAIYGLQKCCIMHRFQETPKS